jgi:hypothetical protein
MGIMLKEPHKGVPIQPCQHVPAFGAELPTRRDSRVCGADQSHGLFAEGVPRHGRSTLGRERDGLSVIDAPEAVVDDGGQLACFAKVAQVLSR